MAPTQTFNPLNPKPRAQELAVMVARSRAGDTQSFPVVETIQKNNICHVTEAPAQVSVELAERAIAVAEAAVASLEGGRRAFHPEYGTLNSEHWTLNPQHTYWVAAERAVGVTEAAVASLEGGRRALNPNPKP